MFQYVLKINSEVISRFMQICFISVHEQEVEKQKKGHMSLIQHPDVCSPPQMLTVKWKGGTCYQPAGAAAPPSPKTTPTSAASELLVPPACSTQSLLPGCVFRFYIIFLLGDFMP